jgi:hypothetical protein
MRSLKASLFLTQHRTGPSITSEPDDIQKKLNDIGAYTHLNNLQLLPTGVEEARYSKASKVRNYGYFSNLVLTMFQRPETAEVRAETESGGQCSIIRRSRTRLATCTQKAPTSAKPQNEVNSCI